MVIIKKKVLEHKHFCILSLLSYSVTMVDTKAVEINQGDLTQKLNECCQIQPKKTKKKSSTKKVESLNPFYEKALSFYPVKLNVSKAKGRHAVAKVNLEEGVDLCKEQATAFVVRSDYIDQQCHVCLADLEEKRMCADCKKTFYCSQACMEKDDLHGFVCDPFAQVDAIGYATDVDPDLLRLMTLLMARKYIDSDKEEKKIEADVIQPTPFWCTEDLISHRDQAEPAFIHVLTEACKHFVMKCIFLLFFINVFFFLASRLLMEMPESIRIPVDDMVTLACRYIKTIFFFSISIFPNLYVI